MYDEYITIDVEKLRRDLMDNYGTAMMNGFPMAVISLSEIENASPEKLVRIAEREGINLRKYAVR